MGQLATAFRAFDPIARRRCRRPQDPQEPVPDSKAGSDFGRWLERAPAEQRLSLCLDFLLYRCAAGDGPADRKTRAELLAADPATLDRRALIKRYVHGEDVHAFGDAVRCVLRGTDQHRHNFKLER